MKSNNNKLPKNIKSVEPKVKKVVTKPNVRQFLNQSCAIAMEMVSICGAKTKTGQLLNDDELKNFKVATDLLTKARQLTIQAKSNAIEYSQVGTTNNLITATSADELKALLSAVNKHAPK